MLYSILSKVWMVTYPYPTLIAYPYPTLGSLLTMLSVHLCLNYILHCLEKITHICRVPGCEAVAHHCPIQDLDEGFYRQFHIVVCGLDSIVARRWLNGMLMSLLQYNDDSNIYGFFILITLVCKYKYFVHGWTFFYVILLKVLTEKTCTWDII